MKSESKRPVTLEDLLQLKRAERPAPEFWSEFDRQLRAKQLAALVEKRPWWQRLPRVGAGLVRYRIPLGAAAVFAVTFVTVREYQGDSSEPRPVAAKPQVAAIVAPVSAPVSSVSESGIPSAEIEPRVQPATELMAGTVERAASSETQPVLVSEATAPGELSRIIPLLGASGPETPAESSPAARHIAANLAVVQASENMMVRGLLGDGTAFASRAQTSRPAVDPLQNMSAPGESRRSRLMSAMVTTTSFNASTRATERAASRIPEDELYERVRRFNAQADRLNFKL